MTDEQRLRDRLTHAVPEPPDSVASAAPVVVRARRARRRRVAGSVVGAAASVALVASLGVALTRTPAPAPGGDRGVASDAGPDPYGTDPCPDALSLQTRVTPFTGELASVRLCAYDRSGEQGVAPQAVPLDALVTNLPTVAARLAALPASASDRCAAATPIVPATALVLTDGDGTAHPFPVGFCSDVDLGRRHVASERVQSVVLAALDAQRSRLGVPADLTAPWADSLCTVRSTEAAPLLPSRDRVVAGAVCRGDLPLGHRRPQRPMTAATLTRVQAAWAEATPLPADTALCAVGFGRWYAVLTSAGDVFTLGSSCGTIAVFASGGHGWDVPLPFSDPLQAPWAPD